MSWMLRPLASRRSTGRFMPWCVPLARWGPVKHMDMTFIIRFLKEQQEVPGVDNDTRVGDFVFKMFQHLSCFFAFGAWLVSIFITVFLRSFRLTPSAQRGEPCGVAKTCVQCTGRWKGGLQWAIDWGESEKGSEMWDENMLGTASTACDCSYNCFLEWWTSQFSQGQKWLVTELFRCSFIPVPPWLRWHIHETCSERPLNS